MLGIRHIHNYAVDLWQGAVEEFVCDQWIGPANANLRDGKLTDFTQNIAKMVDHSTLRHHVISGEWVIPEPSEALLQDFWRSLVSSLTEQTMRKRLTIALGPTAPFEMWQETMMAVLPES